MPGSIGLVENNPPHGMGSAIRLTNDWSSVFLLRKGEILMRHGTVKPPVGWRRICFGDLGLTVEVRNRQRADRLPHQQIGGRVDLILKAASASHCELRHAVRHPGQHAWRLDYRLQLFGGEFSKLLHYARR